MRSVRSPSSGASAAGLGRAEGHKGVLVTRHVLLGGPGAATRSPGEEQDGRSPAGFVPRAAPRPRCPTGSLLVSAPEKWGIVVTAPGPLITAAKSKAFLPRVSWTLWGSLGVP